MRPSRALEPAVYSQSPRDALHGAALRRSPAAVVAELAASAAVHTRRGYRRRKVRIRTCTRRESRTARDSTRSRPGRTQGRCRPGVGRTHPSRVSQTDSATPSAAWPNLVSKSVAPAPPDADRANQRRGMHLSPHAISTANANPENARQPRQTQCVGSYLDGTRQTAGAQSTSPSSTSGCPRRRRRQPNYLSVPGSPQTTPCGTSNNSRARCRRYARQPAGCRSSARNAGSSRGVHG
jgi:hypothetical protein